MRSAKVVFTFIGFVLVAAACNTDVADPMLTTSEDAIASESTQVVTDNGTSLTKILNIAYTSTDKLDVWQPQDTNNAPIAVVFHGSGGVRGFYDPMAGALVDHGFVVINPSWNAAAPFPDNVAGAACAVRYARSQADQLGGDPERILLIGHSAGGGAAALIALGGDALDRDTCTVADVSALPDSFVGLAGGYDPASDPNDPRRGLQTSEPETYDLVDPTTHLGSNPDLRIRLVHGDEDEVIPVQSAVAFHQQLVDASYDSTLNVLEGSGHTEMVTEVFPEFQTAIEEALLAAGLEP